MASRRRTSTPTAEPAAAGYGGSFTGTLFRWNGGKGSWYFIAVPDRLSPPVTHGWGRTPVTATVNGHTWATSVWRGKDGRTLLAVPKQVRGRHEDGARLRVTLQFASL